MADELWGIIWRKEVSNLTRAQDLARMAGKAFQNSKFFRAKPDKAAAQEELSGGKVDEKETIGVNFSSGGRINKRCPPQEGFGSSNHFPWGGRFENSVVG